jgi:lysine 2,3-aminomutase
MSPDHRETWRRLLGRSSVTPGQISRLFSLDEGALTRAAKAYPVRINPYYLSLIRHPDDPIGRQVIPQPAEIEDPEGMEDPLGEEASSPVPNLTHRYPDRVLLLVSNQCAVHCRFCNRKRKVGRGFPVRRETIARAVDYVRHHPEVRDVLLSGGDPLLLPEDELDGILGALRAIPHVEILRIGTRVPCVLPQRVTPALCRTLRRHHPLYVSTHFNHPREITHQARRACALLADAGIPLGCQTVLLRGVNDEPAVMIDLMRGLLAMAVRPYYLFQLDWVRGASHFRTPITRGMEIMDALQASLGGLGLPQYVLDLPGGGGKVPLWPLLPHPAVRDSQGCAGPGDLV